MVVDIQLLLILIQLFFFEFIRIKLVVFHKFFFEFIFFFEFVRIKLVVFHKFIVKFIVIELQQLFFRRLLRSRNRPVCFSAGQSGG